MITDHYLKFPDISTADAVLSKVFGADDAGQAIAQSENHFAVCVGRISKPTGKTLLTEDGDEYPEMRLLDGYHVNLRLLDGALPPALAAYALAAPPLTPTCVFA